MPNYRVVRSEEFKRDLKSLAPQDERLEEVMRALEDALARNPLVGAVVDIDGGHVRVIWGHPLRAMPIRFYYRFDDGPDVELIGALQVRM